MIDIHIKSIPSTEQRYDTVGDWFYDEDQLEIRVNELSNEDYESLIAIHEFVESYLCKKRGITDEQATTFDIKNLDKPGEPGDLPDCPYFREHQFATKIEKLLCDELGIEWDTYNKAQYL